MLTRGTQLRAVARSVTVLLLAVPPYIATAQTAPTGKARPEATASAPKTREFQFTVQGGTRVIATTKAGAPGKARQAVLFTPFLERTDGNLYGAALNVLWNLYGKSRGTFQLQDARMKPEPSLGGQAICWSIANPVTEYCVFPTKDEASGRLAALTVWVK